MPQPMPAYTGNDPYIFVSYSHADEGVVFPEIRWLQDQGINVWYDTTGIGPGSEWNDEIAKAIKGADRFLYFVTPSSVASEHCRRELNFAQSENRRVVVCHLQETTLPDGLRLSLDNRQAILRPQMSPKDYQDALLRSLMPGANGPDTHVGREGSPGTEARWLRRAAPGAVIFLLVMGLGWWYMSGPTDSGVTPEPSKPSVAVLPFANLSNDPEQLYFSSGIAEDLLNALASNPDVIVRPRSSSFAPNLANLDLQNLADRLQVTHVLEGSVRRADGRVRVTVQLVEVFTNRPVWSDRYDRDVNDIFKVQDEITAQILTALDAKLGESAEPREFISEEAWAAVLRGRHHMDRWEFMLAIEWLEKATELNPRDASAWATLAQARLSSVPAGEAQSPDVMRELTEQAIGRALALDSNNPDALAVQAAVLFQKRQFQTAIDTLAIVLKRNPKHDFAIIALRGTACMIGREELCLAVAAYNRRIAPAARAPAEAEIAFRITFGHFEAARTLLAAYERLGYNAPVQVTTLALADRDYKKVRAMVASPQPFFPGREWMAGVVMLLEGDLEGAAAIANELRHHPEYQSSWWQFRLSLLERNVEASLSLFELSIQAEDNFFPLMRASNGHAVFVPIFREFYGDPRYAALLREYGLDPESLAQITVPALPFL